MARASATPAPPSSRSEGKRARRVADTRARIIDVALDLFVHDGFGTTTIEQIAAAAGIGRSSFFRYFASKEAVLFAPAAASHTWFLDELRARPPHEPLVASVAAVCVDGEWPAIRRQDILRARKVLRAAPELRRAMPTQVTSASPELIDLLQERALDADPLTVRAVADLTFNWTTAAMTAHIEDGRPLTEHFAAVIGATCSLADDLAALPAGVLH